MDIKERIEELRLLIKDNEVAIEFLDEIESDIEDLENESIDLEDQIDALEKDLHENTIFNTFDISEYDLPLGTVKIWSDNLVLKMKLEAFVEHVLLRSF